MNSIGARCLISCVLALAMLPSVGLGLEPLGNTVTEREVVRKAQRLGAVTGVGEARASAKPVPAGPLRSEKDIEQPRGGESSSQIQSDMTVPRASGTAAPWAAELEATLRRTETILNGAGLLVVAVTFIFTAAVVVGGFINYKRYKQQARAIRTFRAEMATFQANLVEQQAASVATRRFLDSVWIHYSDLLVGIVGTLHGVLSVEDDRQVRGRIFEAEAALNLFHPREEEVRAALWKLERIGTDVSVPSLARLIEDKEASAEIRMHAKDALMEIRERLRSAEHGMKGSQPAARSPGPPVGPKASPRIQPVAEPAPVTAGAPVITVKATDQGVMPAGGGSGAGAVVVDRASEGDSAQAAVAPADTSSKEPLRTQQHGAEGEARKDGPPPKVPGR